MRISDWSSDVCSSDLLQMARLILFVADVRKGKIGQLVEGDDPVGLGIVDPLRLARLRQGLVVEMPVREGPGRTTAQQHLVQPALERAADQAPFEGGTHVTRLPKHLADPGLPDRLAGSRQISRRNAADEPEERPGRTE